MPEIKQEVQTFRITYRCDKCGEGDMKSDGHGISNSFETFWLHSCNSCGFQERYHHSYPRIVTRAKHNEIEGEQP